MLGEPAIVASEFPVTVRYVPVRDGERVTAGSVAALVTSQTVIENIANFENTPDVGLSLSLAWLSLKPER